MEIHEAAKILNNMYNSAPGRTKALSVHLFAIKYANEISDLSLRQLVEYAELPPRYETEIRKGKNIAPYVIFKG